MSWAVLADGVLQAGMAAFGTRFSYAPKGAGRPAGPFTLQPDGLPLTGVYDAKHALIEMNSDGAPVSTTAPVLGVRLSVMPAPPLAGDEATILEGPDAGLVYRVADPQPDGQGGAKLILEKK